MPAGCAWMTKTRPSVSTMAWRLCPLTFLPASKPLGLPASTVLTLWLSDHRGRRTGLASGLFAISHDKVVIYGPEQTFAAEAQEPAIDSRHRREVLGQKPPSNATPQHIEDGVHDLAHRPLTRPAVVSDIPALRQTSPTAMLSPACFITNANGALETSMSSSNSPPPGPGI